MVRNELIVSNDFRIEDSHVRGFQSDYLHTYWFYSVFYEDFPNEHIFVFYNGHEIEHDPFKAMAVSLHSLFLFACNSANL